MTWEHIYCFNFSRAFSWLCENQMNYGCCSQAFNYLEHPESEDNSVNRHIHFSLAYSMHPFVLDVFFFGFYFFYLIWLKIYIRFQIQHKFAFYLIWLHWLRILSSLLYITFIWIFRKVSNFLFGCKIRNLSFFFTQQIFSTFYFVACT